MENPNISEFNTHPKIYYMENPKISNIHMKKINALGNEFPWGRWEIGPGYPGHLGSLPRPRDLAGPHQHLGENSLDALDASGGIRTTSQKSSDSRLLSLKCW